LNDLIHSAEWNIPVRLTDYFTLSKTEADFITYDLSGVFNLVYFDAFGPDKQPEMWTEDLFAKISDVVVPGGMLVTYSAKGTVKRALLSCGFDVTLLPGPPGKRQVLRAVRRDKIH
jgi:tRNA U34 5-methylaminomethyl-2-thiouridine-forming methyltransferase MnmC